MTCDKTKTVTCDKSCKNSDPVGAQFVRSPSMGTVKKPDLSKELMIFDKKKVLNNLSDGPKFLIISRSDEGQTMDNVSPFLMRKCINHVVGGKVRQMSALRNGTILIETENLRQAQVLITLKRITPLINLEITEHSRLNSSKGVVNRCYEWKFLSDADIIEGLREYDVTEIHRITRKNERGEIVDTGTYFLTFSTTQLPREVDIGYSFREVLPYVPNPMICFNCLKFNHPKDRCKQTEKICQNCAQTFHTENLEKCSRPALCVNCNGDHPSLSKVCPVFLKNKEIQRIKVIDNITYTAAVNKYYQMNPFHNQPSFASFLKNKSCNCKCSCNQESNQPIRMPPINTEMPRPSTSTAIVTHPTTVIETKRKNSTDAAAAANKETQSEDESEEVPSQHSSSDQEMQEQVHKEAISAKMKGHTAKFKHARTKRTRKS